jgi:hypothetical protein
VSDDSLRLVGIEDDVERAVIRPSGTRWVALSSTGAAGGEGSETAVEHGGGETRGDLALGLVDASVLALAKRLDEPKLATLDQRHFRVVRPSHVASLELRP